MSAHFVINFKNVTKSYGKARGVTNVRLSVNKGEVFGFLGPNGAGKSTAINMMMDLIRPTSGSIELFGKDTAANSLEIRRRVGFLASDIALDTSLTGWQQLEYFANLRSGLNKKYVRELAARLDCQLSKRFKTLSRGNKQKIGLIAALMDRPDLLILDEPTSGLDPLIQAEFNKIILEQKARGVTVFISSHTLSEVQALCERIGFIREGQLVAVKSMHELSAAAPKEVRVVSSNKHLAKRMEKLNGVAGFTARGDVITFTTTGDINRVIQLASSAKVVDITIQDADLETIFMHYYEKEARNV